MKIHIIRHAEPDYSIDSLTEKGWREARLLSERIAAMPIDDYYSSPLGRARDTAKPSVEKTGKTIEVLPWLQEFAGEIKSPFTGEKRCCWDLPPYLWGKEEKFYDIKEWKNQEPIKGGTAEAVYDETVRGIDELLLRYGWERDGMLYRGGEDKTIALFCHFAMGITVLSHLVGISPVVAQHNFFLAPSSVTTLVTETDSKGYSHFRAVEVGDTSHLYIKGEPMSLSGLYPNFEK